VIGQDRELIQGQRVVRGPLRDVGGDLRGAAGGFDLGGAAADGAADRRARHFRVEQRGHGVRFLGCGESVADQTGDRHRPCGRLGGGEVGTDDARQTKAGRCGLAAVPVHRNVRHRLGPVVAGDQGDRNDDQRDQHADLGHRGGQLLDAPRCVADVLRVLRHLTGV